jgi:hypothetical protein
MTNRIGGSIPPEPPRGPKGSQGPGGKKFEPPVEEIRKVDETELEKRGKRFLKKGVEEEDELEESETRSPSPFETEFHKQQLKAPVGFSELEGRSHSAGLKGTILGSASGRKSSGPLGYSGGDEGGSLSAAPFSGAGGNLPPSPSPESGPSYSGLSDASPSSQPVVDENLPESEQFWENFDLPDQPPVPAKLEEQSSLNQGKRVSAEKKSFEGKKEALLIAESKRKQEKAAKEKSGLSKEALAYEKKEGKEKAESLPSPWELSAKTGKKGQPLSKEMQGKEKQAKEQAGQIASMREQDSGIPLTPQRGKKEEEAEFQVERASALIQEREEKEREKKKEKTSASTPVQPPDPLPPSCIRIAEAAQTSASPFLNPQTAELFSKMVGTIVFMTASKGAINTTEVLLNSPSFKNSALFNSTIIIEKYPTAPDSFNIRLTGTTDQAVQLFNNNLESLSSAFAAAYEDRRVTFRIGRIDAELAPDRYLIRRKKEGGSKENLR